MHQEQIISDGLKVMGPGASNLFGPVLSPPKLNTETEKYQWRIDVKTLAVIVKRFAKAGDNKAKGLLNALGLRLYYSLE